MTIWGWLGFTRTARTSHVLRETLRKALTDEELHELAAYNSNLPAHRGTVQHQTRMRALQDRYDASVREAAALLGGKVVE